MSLHEGRFVRRAKLDDPRSAQVTAAVARAQQGDREAVRFLYLRFCGNVYGYAASMLRDDHEAEDLTQKVFVKMITSIGDYEQRDVPFSSWLMRIAHNMAIDHLRRRARVAVAALPPDLPAPAPTPELSLALREALAELPDDQRKVVFLRHVAGWTPGEIARKLGRSEDAIHGLHHRGRRALRKTLTDRGIAPAT